MFINIEERKKLCRLATRLNKTKDPYYKSLGSWIINKFKIKKVGRPLGKVDLNGR